MPRSTSPVRSRGVGRHVARGFEYLAAGAPSSPSRVGVVPEILADGEHALLVPAGDAAALATPSGACSAIPRCARELGEAGRRLSSNGTRERGWPRRSRAQYTRLTGAL